MQAKNKQKQPRYTQKQAQNSLNQDQIHPNSYKYLQNFTHSYRNTQVKFQAVAPLLYETIHKHYSTHPIIICRQKRIRFI